MTLVMVDTTARHYGLQNALREFKKKVQRSRVLHDLKHHRWYDKPSRAKRLKRRRAIHRRQRECQQKLKRKARKPVTPAHDGVMGGSCPEQHELPEV